MRVWGIGGLEAMIPAVRVVAMLIEWTELRGIVRLLWRDCGMFK